MTSYLTCGECGTGLSGYAMTVSRLDCQTHQYCRAILSLPDEVRESLGRHLRADNEGALTIAPGAPVISDLWCVAFPWPGLLQSDNSSSAKLRAEHIAKTQQELLG